MATTAARTNYFKPWRQKTPGQIEVGTAQLILGYRIWATMTDEQIAQALWYILNIAESREDVINLLRNAMKYPKRFNNPVIRVDDQGHFHATIFGRHLKVIEA